MAITLDYIRQLCYQGESFQLDYKREQYVFANASDSEKEKLLKDILAMANSFRSQVAYILIGVAQQESGAGEIKGIPQSSYIDDAKLQQFVNEKTNRIIEFQSYSVPIDNEKIIQVIEIPVQKERPYYLRKQFASIPKNTVYFRIGSSTNEATPDEIAKMGKEEIIQQNQREIEISLIVPQNLLEETNFTALDIVLDGDPPVETNVEKQLFYIKGISRPVYFTEKIAFVRDVFRTVRVDIALENKSALSAEQLEVETYVSQCSYRCVTKRKHFPEHPFEPSAPIMNSISSVQQRRLHPGQFEPAFESRYFEVNHDGDFTFDVTVLGKDMQPIHKSFLIHVQLKKYPLPSERIEQMFESLKNEDLVIQYIELIQRG